MPTKVILNKSGTVKLKKSKTLQLKARVEPENASTTLTWMSSDENVAYVDGNGTVYGLKRGICTISVKINNGKYDTVKIRVYY